MQQSAPPSLQFARSESTVQKMSFPAQNVKESELACSRPGWFQHRFGKEHEFGSAVLLANTFSTSLQIRAGLKEQDISRLVGGTLATALNVWTFLSSRGAKAPQGETAMERIMDTIRHPSQSAVHFAAFCSIFISAIFTSGHFYKGFKGDASEYTRRLTAGITFLSTVMLANGVFSNYKSNQDSDSKKPKASPILFAQSQSEQVSRIDRVKEVFQEAWQTDKRGLIARGISICCQLADLREGLTKRNVIGKASSTLLTSSLVDLSVVLGQAYYFYDRLARDNHPQTAQPLMKEQLGTIRR